MGKKKEKKEVPVVQEKAPVTAIEYAIAQKCTVAELKELMVLRERDDAFLAKKQYNVAMARVHCNMPSVTKTEKNTQTSSKYAGLDCVIKAVKPIYSSEGFAVSFYEGDTGKEDHVRICMDITHASGHKETSHYDMPLDGKGLRGNPNMTAIHGKSSSISYGRRYLLCMGFNIATGDDDGNAAGGEVECITDSQHSKLTDLIVDSGADEKKFCEVFKISEVSKMPKTDFNRAKIALVAKKSGKMGKK